MLSHCGQPPSLTADMMAPSTAPMTAANRPWSTSLRLAVNRGGNLNSVGKGMISSRNETSHQGRSLVLSVMDRHLLPIVQQRRQVLTIRGLEGDEHGLQPERFPQRDLALGREVRDRRRVRRRRGRFQRRHIGWKVLGGGMDRHGFLFLLLGHLDSFPFTCWHASM